MQLFPTKRVAPKKIMKIIEDLGCLIDGGLVGIYRTNLNVNLRCMYTCIIKSKTKTGVSTVYHQRQRSYSDIHSLQDCVCTCNLTFQRQDSVLQ